MFASLGKSISKRSNVAIFINARLGKEEDDFKKFINSVASSITERLDELYTVLSKLNHDAEMGASHISEDWGVHTQNTDNVYLKFYQPSNSCWNESEIVITQSGEVHIGLDIPINMWETHLHKLCHCSFRRFDWQCAIKEAVLEKISHDLTGCMIEISTPAGNFDLLKEKTINPFHVR